MEEITLKDPGIPQSMKSKSGSHLHLYLSQDRDAALGEARDNRVWRVSSSCS